MFLRRFLNFSKYFHYFVIFSPWKKAGPSFEQTWIPFTQGCFVPSLIKIGPVVLEKEMKMRKVYRLTTDGGWQTIRIAHLSFQFRWAKNHQPVNRSFLGKSVEYFIYRQWLKAKLGKFNLNWSHMEIKDTTFGSL